jgi:hypothetical protein
LGIGLEAIFSEKLDKMYVCMQCNAAFIFKNDVEEHVRDMPNHGDFDTRPIY